MKKLLTLIAALSMTAFTANAQQEPGTFSITPKVGITSGKFSNDPPIAIGYASGIQINPQGGIYDPSDVRAGMFSFTPKNKSKVGIACGFDVQYQIKPTFGVSLGLTYLSQGMSFETKDGTFDIGYPEPEATVVFKDDMKLKLQYLAIPVVAHIYVAKNLALNCGIQPEINIGKSLERNLLINPINTNSTNNTNSYSKQMSDKPENYKNFVVSLPIGLSYEYKNFVADVRYNFGLTDVMKVEDSYDFSSIRNNVLAITLGYKIGL